MDTTDRYKCSIGKCGAAFDDETQRDLHEAIEVHCEGCGTPGRSLCLYCKFDREAAVDDLVPFDESEDDGCE